MSLTHAAFGTFSCTVAMLFATVACGGSVPAPNATPEPRAVASTPEASSSPDSVASTPGGTTDDPSASAKAAPDGKGLDFRFGPTGELVLNGVALSEKTEASELTKRLGSPTREKTRPSGEVSLYHDEKGLVLWTKDKAVAGVGMNFNWDGDNKFPETSFTGTLVMGDLKVDRSTTLAQFKSLKGAPISCLSDSMCAGKSGHTKFIAGSRKT